MRLSGIFLLLTIAGWSAELQLSIALRWGNDELALPQGGLHTSTGQLVEITRLSALLSDFQLLRPDGSVVRLEGQYGYIDAASGRLGVALQNVPAGDYKGLQMVIGVPAALNHADPGIWPAGHPLNPQVNAMHWNWSGGYVFLALEGYWQDVGGGNPSGFSYHLAGDEQTMRVRFLTSFAVQSPTRVTLALDASKLFRDRKIAQADGSDSTHSAAGDELAAQLTRATERAFFWLGASPAQVAESDSLQAPVAQQGTPVAFIVPAGFPQPALPSDNPLTDEGIELGRRLFGDRRLSGNESQSCVTCHDPANAFSDRVALSRGADGTPGVRNAMPLFNLAWHPAYAWDGSKKTIRAQSIAAMTNPIEMNADLGAVVAKLADDPQVAADFAQAFGSPEITGERIGLALEQFLLTEISADSRLDRATRGEAELTAEEQLGFALFLTEYDPVRGKRGGDCFHCHGGGLFSDFVARSNGLDTEPADAGLKNVTGLVYDNGRFKTPSLRNVALTAPYMHDGRFATLEEVVAHYDHGVQRPANLDPNLAKHPATGMQLTSEEQGALVAFLKTLTDAKYEGFVTPPDGPTHALVSK
jgi:cytochrome c peroxidase